MKKFLLLFLISISLYGQSNILLFEDEPIVYNDIGIAGGLGFGVGVCPPSALPPELVPLPNNTIKGHANYGNYKVKVDNSIMVYVPAFCYKVVHDGIANINSVYIKSFSKFNYDTTYATSQGYVIHRAFIDGGVILKGIFIDKYKWSLTNSVEGVSGIASSIALSNPISSSSATKRYRTATITNAVAHGDTVTVTASSHGFFNTNSVTITGVVGMTDLNNTFTIFNKGTNTFDVTLTTAQSYTSGGSAKVADFPGSFSNCISNSQTPLDDYGGAWAAAKSRGSNFYVMSIFASDAIALLSLAHAQASTSTTYAAWYHATYNYPKGNNNLGADINDATCTFTACDDAYWGVQNLARKNGGANNLAKTTHNGQLSGISGVNGNQWEIVQGLTTHSMATKNLTAITRAAQAVFTVADITGLANDMVIQIQGSDTEEWNTAVQYKFYTISDVSGNTFKLKYGASYVNTSALSLDYDGSGLTIMYGIKFFVLNEAASVKNITGGNSVTTTDHFNTTFINNNFTEITLSFAMNGYAFRYGSTTAQVIPFSLSRTSNSYRLSSAGMTVASTSLSTGGTDQFGKDYHYQWYLNELCALHFGIWSNNTSAGVWCLSLSNGRTSTNNSASARSCLYTTN